jgi:hypothetical protein
MTGAASFPTVTTTVPSTLSRSQSPSESAGGHQSSSRSRANRTFTGVLTAASCPNEESTARQHDRTFLDLVPQGIVGGPVYRRRPGTGPLAAEGRMQAKKWLYSGSSDQECVPEASI